MPNQIEQLYEQSEILADVENNSKHYWKIGYLGTVFQSYFDVKELIDESKKDKEQRNQILLEERKNAFLTIYRDFPPWINKWTVMVSISPFHILGAYFLPNQSFIFNNIWTNYVFKE